MPLDHWALSLIVFLPLVGAAVLTLVPRARETLQLVVALITTLLVCVVGIYVLFHFDYRSGEVQQFVVDNGWIGAINSRYHVGIDGISLPLLVLSMLTMTACVVYCFGHLPEPRNAKALLGLVLLIETGVNGTFLARDLILFFVFFELVLFPMYFLVGIWGGPRRHYASLKFFVYTVLGSALLLLAFLGLYFLGGDTFDITRLASSASPLRSASHDLQVVMFSFLVIGFAVKVPLFPFHTWMTDAHTEAPTVASVILAGVMLKLGGYGFIRIALPVLPDAARSAAPLIASLGVVGVIYGAFACLAQRDMKRLIAFSSLAHMGFVMLGVATLTPLGIDAAVFAMVAHGLVTAMLFFLCGSIQQRFGTREISRLSGLLSIVPRLAWILGFCAVASFGLPGLAGFWGEFLSLVAAYRPAHALPTGSFRALMVLGALGAAMATGYSMWMYQRVAFGSPSESLSETQAPDTSRVEYAVWAPMLVLIVVLGLLPSFLLDVTHPAAEHLVRTMEMSR